MTKQDIVQNWLSISAIVISVLAVIGPPLWEWLTPGRVRGKVISLIDNRGIFGGKQGMLYFLRLAVIAIKKPINIKTIEIFVKYSDTETRFKGEWIWGQKSFWVIKNGEPRQRLIIPISEFLGFKVTLPENEPVSCYLTFRIDKAEISEIEDITILFTDYREKQKSLHIPGSELDPSHLVFDESIWTPITQDEEENIVRLTQS